MRTAFLPLALLGLVSACAASSGAPPSPASSAASLPSAAETPAPMAMKTSMAQGTPDPAAVPEGTPLATLDLMTTAGAEAVGGQWRYSDVKIVEVPFTEADANGQPGKTPNRAYDISPRAGRSDFDDGGWKTIAPETLDVRRTAGKVSFNWYRIAIEIPEEVGAFDPTGSTVVLHFSVDDYAETWVDGELARAFGQRGGSVVSGWNAPNRVVIGRDVKPGQVIKVAIFGINGPISQAPTNYIYIRKADLEFFEGPRDPVPVEPQEVNVLVERKDPAIEAILPSNPKIFKLAENFTFTEGPIWVGDALRFSDPNENRIYQLKPDEKELTIFRRNSGYQGADVARYGQPGSNGLTLDPQGRLTTCEHGNRRVTRTESDGTITVLADKFQGKRLNSPNDLVFRSDGTLYFTDPPFGLPKFYDDPDKELPFSGVYRVKDGKVTLLDKRLRGPNGIALSPDEKTLYVGNWDPKRKIVMQYRVKKDGSVGRGRVFADMTSAPFEEAIDGVKVDVEGNVYVAGPGGIWIFSSTGKHLGTVRTPSGPHNMAWGGEDGKTLYITAESRVYRMPLKIAGVRPKVDSTTTAGIW